MPTLQLIIGPMFSGKTTELLKLVRRYRYGKKKVLVIKYAMDQRYDVESVTTHDHVKEEAISKMKLMESIDDIDQYDVIAIDEGQMFDDLEEFVRYCLFEKRKKVLISALDGTYHQKPFKNITNLIPLADKVNKLTSICNNCGKKSSCTYRTTKEKKIIVIGGSEMYESRCLYCISIK